MYGVSPHVKSCFCSTSILTESKECCGILEKISPSMIFRANGYGGFWVSSCGWERGTRTTKLVDALNMQLLSFSSCSLHPSSSLKAFFVSCFGNTRCWKGEVTNKLEQERKVVWSAIHTACLDVKPIVLCVQKTGNYNVSFKRHAQIELRN